MLPLHAQTPFPAGPEGWHHVQAPGGYEFWRFIAGDPGRDLWLTALVSWGSILHPDYLRRYARYRRRPTRHRPPVPGEDCSITFALYESGRATIHFDALVGGDEFSITPGQLTAGDRANLVVDSDGRLHLHLSQCGTPERRTTAKLVFEPLPAGSPPEIELPEGQAPVHRWSLSRPVCRVSGEVMIFQGPSASPRVINLNGRGCHDHAWGIRPPAWDFCLGFRGYVLDAGRTFAFAHLLPRGAKTHHAPDRHRRQPRQTQGCAGGYRRLAQCRPAGRGVPEADAHRRSSDTGKPPPACGRGICS